MDAYHLQSVISPRGHAGVINVRDETSDLSLVFGSFSDRWTRGGDEYGLRELHVTGSFVDVGAHIGAIALAVALDNPVQRIVLVEPVPENMAMARATFEANGLAATFVSAAIGTTKVRLGRRGTADEYVGNIGYNRGRSITVDTVTLADLVEMAGGHIDVLKVDCEGCEYALLDADLSQVDTIFGEWHGGGRERLETLLAPTHDITLLTDLGGIGLFRAVRRG